MVQTLSLPTLNQCRDTAKIVFMYKILHQIVDVSVPDCYLSPISWNTQGHPSRFIQLQINIDAYEYSFYLSAIGLWNALLNHVIEANFLKAYYEVKLFLYFTCNLCALTLCTEPAL